MAAFGSATPVSKIVTGAMPPFIGSALRVGIGALVLAPFAVGRWRGGPRLAARDWRNVVVIALFGMFGFSALMLYGMRMVPGAAGAIVMSTAPAVTAAGAILFTGESASWRKLAAVALAVIGVAVLQLDQSGGSEGGNLLLGSALVFGAVCCEAVYTLVGKRATERIDPLVVAFLGAAVSLPMFVPFALWQWQDFAIAEVPPHAWIAVAWYGAGTLAIGSWLWYSGIARAEGSVAAGFMGVMPASALILSYVLLGEEARALHLIGFAVVFAGVLLVSWEHARMQH
ncbi:DMT family transporter [Desertibaculum subflavum]|uniref:DMT family transporter n=1 Tax=Desertibaculum subflavum TaxID=2268458 RepID=UPI0013C51EB2